MKNIGILFLLSLAIVSCQKESITDRANGIKIIGLNESDNTLKTAFVGAGSAVNWIAGTDHIGLFSDLAIVDGGGKVVNVDFTAEQNASSSTFTSPTTIYFNGTTTLHSFSAIYPYKAATFPSDAWTAVPISLPATQTQVGTTTAHIGPLDMMVAKTSLIPVPGGTNPTLTFTFHHIFTILKFNITCATAHTLKEVNVANSDGRIITVSDGNTFNIGQDYPGAGLPYGLNNPSGGTTSVKLITDMAITSTPASAYVMIFPQNFTGFFTLSFKNENGTVYSFTKSSITLERGKVYDVAVTIPNGGGANAWE